MNKQPYSQWQKVQGSVRWDREKFPKPNLHVYDKDDTKIVVYNMRKWQRTGGSKNLEQKRLKNTSLKEELLTRD